MMSIKNKPKLDMEKLKKEMREAKEEVEKRKLEERTPKVIGKCVVCEGDVKQIMQVHYPRGRTFVGKQGAYYYSNESYCVKCGIKYHKVKEDEEI